MPARAALLTLLTACTADPALISTSDDTGDSGTATTATATDCPLLVDAEGWTEESHAKGTPGDADRIFPDDAVIRLDITLCAGDWEALQEDLDAVMTEAGITPGSDNGGGGGPGGGGPGGGGPGGEGGGGTTLSTDPSYVPVTVAFDGKTWPSVGFRYKGNSSLWGPYAEGRSKLPFRLEFDQFEDEAPELEDQRFWGFKELKFSSAYTDDSLIRDRLAATTFREAGVPAARGGFVEVYVDSGDGPVYWGLYTAFEAPCGELLDDWFGDDDGNCYEAEDADLTELNTEGLEKKTNQDDDDWSDVAALIETLADSELDAEAWRAQLEAQVDVDGFLWALAVNNLIGNWDSYGLMAHNYFLYADPGDDGRIVWIPWDFNMSYSSQSMQAPLSMGMEEAEDRWPMIRRLMDDEVYVATYKADVADLLEGAFDEDTQKDRMARWHALVADSAAAEAEPYTNLPNSADFEAALDEAADSLTGRVDEARAEAEDWLSEE